MAQRRYSSSSTAQNVCRIKVSKIQADTVPATILRHGRFFITVQTNDETRKTIVEVAESARVIWDDELHFDAPNGSSITFTLSASHHLWHDAVVGSSKEKIGSNLWSANSVERRLRNESGTPLGTHLHFKVELLSDDAPAARMRQEKAMTIHGASKAQGAQIVEAIPAVIGAIYAAHVPGTEAHARGKRTGKDKRPDNQLDLGKLVPISDVCNVVLRRVGYFNDIVSQIAEVHPYAKFAWNVLTMACKVVLAQKERDDKVQKLIELISDLYSFWSELGSAQLSGHQATMKLMALQTTECAYFIRDYNKHKSFMFRAAKSAVFGSAVDEKLAEYEKKIWEIKTAFRTEAALNIEIAVVRIPEHVERIVTEIALDDLPYARGARFDRGRQRLPGTRVKALEEIFEWANDFEKPRVLVLSGPAGCGKSAIAHTVSHTFDELKRLGSSFFFDRDARPERRLSMLFSTMTRDLADLDPKWKASLKQVIVARALRRTGSLVEQFEEFLLKPARSFPMYSGPVVVVINALEASGNSTQRRELLSLLSTRATELPRNFRILITTQPEDDIMHAFNHGNNVACWNMDTIVDKESNFDDIAAYFSHQLAAIPGLQWSEKLSSKLAAKAEGDFAWATTICSFVKEHVPGQPAEELISHILSTPREGTSSDKEESHLKSLRGTLRRTLHLRPRSQPPSVSVEDQLATLLHPRPLSVAEYSNGSADSRPPSPSLSHTHPATPSVDTTRGSLRREGSVHFELRIPHLSRPPSRENHHPTSKPLQYPPSSLYSTFPDPGPSNSRPPSRNFTFPKPEPFQPPAPKFPDGVGEDSATYVAPFHPIATAAPRGWRMSGANPPAGYMPVPNAVVDDHRSPWVGL